MSDQHLPDDLDRLLRQRAARWRRQHPADRSLTDFVPAAGNLVRRNGRRRWAPALIAAAMVLVAASATLVIVTRDRPTVAVAPADPLVTRSTGSSASSAPSASSSPIPIPIPAAVPCDLVGQQLDAATATLEKSNLQVRAQRTRSPKPENEVLEVVGCGSKIPENGVVTLNVSDGSQFVMPDISGDKPEIDVAVQRLQEAGWSGPDSGALTQNPTETPNESEWGRVIAQSPTIGAAASKLGRPTVAIGREPTFPMPNLQAKTLDEARDTLAGLDYRVDNLQVVELDNANPADDNRVAYQQTPENTEVTITDRITIAVYKAAPPR